ncbi:MAG TPA: SDR family NAD(P)-dependent oxidoreductase [Spirochaetota bacterium]|nr:SDR family NAD(P)-dependent oxidoreductase [Spirochaetota bacterium]HPI91281.1 SDR family NAD(P)-dependent oxidoreductase [Spirochaetota bacterium]HPR49838.1 SDR family NAD(P)-dependent oxidoreductase [Spirochaetota bacterium]
MKKELVLITGCDSGIGKSCAELLLEAGHQLALSYLNNNPFNGNPRCHAYRVDMTGESEVAGFAESIKKLCANGFSLKCLFLNAGVALGGPVENIPLATFRKVMEVNFFSYVLLIQKLIPLLRESRGMIMINGSLAGKVALPFLAPYTSSKHAIEGFADSLRRELNPFGIKTVLIELAAVATPIWAKARAADSSFVDEVYRGSVDMFLVNFVDAGNRGMPVHRAAADIIAIMNKKRPGPRYIISGSRLSSKTQTMIPDRVLDTIVKKLFRMNYGGNV